LHFSISSETLIKVLIRKKTKIEYTGIANEINDLTDVIVFTSSGQGKKEISAIITSTNIATIADQILNFAILLRSTSCLYFEKSSLLMLIPLFNKKIIEILSDEDILAFCLHPCHKLNRDNSPVDRFMIS
jgi:hypothetical protein